MLNKEQTVKECDAREDDNNSQAWNKNPLPSLNKAQNEKTVPSLLFTNYSASTIKVFDNTVPSAF
jgi:hypothetical protein